MLLVGNEGMYLGWIGVPIPKIVGVRFFVFIFGWVCLFVFGWVGELIFFVLFNRVGIPCVSF